MAKARKEHPKPKSRKSVKKTIKLIKSNYEKIEMIKKEMGL